MSTVATTEPLTVELPVCPHPDCRRVGKLPAHISRKDWCSGGIRTPHKATKMVNRVFVQQPLEGDQG